MQRAVIGVEHFAGALPDFFRVSYPGHAKLLDACQGTLALMLLPTSIQAKRAGLGRTLRNGLVAVAHAIYPLTPDAL